MNITYDQFTKKVNELHNTTEFCYGSVQYPARAAADYFKKQGIENAEALYEQFRANKGRLFTYAGD